MIVVICPTPTGGHIEHAASLAEELALDKASNVRLVTRRGAVEYLGEISGVEVQERLRENGSACRGTRRLTLLLLSVVQEEYLKTRTFLQMTPSDLMVLEEPRFLMLGIARLLRRSGPRVVLFVHNAVEHESSGGPRYRVKKLMRSSVISNADKIVVHGSRQETALSNLKPRSIVVVDLPAAGAIERKVLTGKSWIGGGADLCLGEIRPNKGVEIAMEASQLARRPLRVVGKAIDKDYLRKLTLALEWTSDIDLLDEFISAEDFVEEISRAAVVLLPYTRFAAQSGVLTKAMLMGAPVVASDLPSLREQAEGYERILYFRPGDPRDLAEKLGQVEKLTVSDAGYGVVTTTWSEVASAVKA